MSRRSTVQSELIISSVAASADCVGNFNAQSDARIHRDFSYNDSKPTETANKVTVSDASM